MDSANSKYRTKSIMQEKLTPGVSDVCYTPLSAKNRVTQDDDDTILLEGARQLEGIAMQYDSEHAEHAEMIDQLADEISRVHEYRRARIVDRKKEMEQRIESAENLKHRAADTKAVDQYVKNIQHHVQQKKDLERVILQGEEKQRKIKEEIVSIEDEIDDLRNSNRVLKHKAESELPTLLYIQKILRLLSGAKISSEPGSEIIEGFICKDEENDLIPFEFDKTEVSEYDRVNAIWEMINNSN